MIDYFELYKKDKHFLNHLKKILKYFNEINEILENLEKDCPLDPKLTYDINIKKKKLLIIKKEK